MTAPSSSSAPPLAPGLYIVATPIGNLGDLSDRARDILRRVDAIACEDSRVTQKLLSSQGITNTMLPYHDHSKASVRQTLLDRIANGAALALVSDAGTPLIADPGYKLVREAQEAGLMVTAVPGPSAIITALCLSGLPTDRFMFMGFLPSKAKAREKVLQEVADIPATLIFYESAARTSDSLRAMANLFGPRPAVMARELTKRFETVRREPLDALAAWAPTATNLKGEVVLLVAGAQKVPGDADAMDRLLLDALSDLSTKEAAAAVAWTLNLPRRQVYQRALELKNG